MGARRFPEIVSGEVVGAASTVGLISAVTVCGVFEKLSEIW
jgi:hypothetical protein